jgi:hypothetical protein
MVEELTSQRFINDLKDETINSKIVIETNNLIIEPE